MQNLERKSVFNWNWLFGRNKMWCAVTNHKYMCHICAKGF